MTDLTIPAVEARKSPFSTVIPHFQVAWDSTSLGTFKECPRKYYYQHILGWQTKHASVHLIFGQLYHSGMEAYDHYAASIGKLGGGLTNDEHDEGIRRALLHVFRQSGRYVQADCFECHGVGTRPAGPTALEMLEPPIKCEACDGKGKIGPRLWEGWRSTDEYKNMWTLCRSIVLYLDEFRNSPLRTVVLKDGRPAVELSFYFDAGEVDGISYGFCGHLDRVVESPADGDRKSVHDRKTTKGQLNARYWAGFNPHNQFNLYTAAGSIHYEQPSWGITVDAAQILVNSTRFARQFIPYPPQLVDEFLGEAHTWITIAARYAQAGNWPKNDKSCSNYGGCPFQKVCSKAPAFRQAWLESDFVPFHWNPLQIRGDI